MTGINHFPALLAAIRQAAPELSLGAAKHAGNKIANHIRRSHQDCYGIEVSRRPLSGPGYFDHFEIEASGTRLYVRQTVD